MRMRYEMSNGLRFARASSKMSAQQIVKSKEKKKRSVSISGKDRKAVIIAQEIKFARLLSHKDKKVRDKAVKNLRKWLTIRSKSSFAFTESDFMRLWKGLYYCMWMSDKLLIQEELAESLSNLVHCFNTKDVVLLYIMCVLKTLAIEWYGLDHYRLDKFAMLTRRIIRQMLKKCKETSWNLEWMKGISEILEEILIDKKTCIGFSMHLTEIFMEELSKISNGDISEDVVTELIKPFISYLTTMNDKKQIKHIMKHVFEYLIFQSDVGMDYMEKFSAWKKSGFPTGSIDAMEKLEMSDEEIDDVEDEESLQERMKDATENPLDPRAGRVDVELPQIPFNGGEIAKLMSQYKVHSSSTIQSRRQLRFLIKAFTELSKGEMPLGVKEIFVPNIQKKDMKAKLAAERLLEHDQKLYSDNVKKKCKRKNNGQLVEDETDEFSRDEDLKHSEDEGNAKIDEMKPPRKKKKKQLKIDDNIDATESNVEVDVNVSNLKKKKHKPKNKSHDASKTHMQNGDCELKRDSLVSIKDGVACKKMKLKKKNSNGDCEIKRDSLVLVKDGCKKMKLKKKNSNGDCEIKRNLLVSVKDGVGYKKIKLKKKNSNGDCEIKRDSLVLVKDGIGCKKMKLKKNSTASNVLNKLEHENGRTAISLKEHKRSSNLNAKKRVKIVLQRNTAQHTSDYLQQVYSSPSIPYDANKKPLVGVLKASPIPSPINPFYKKTIK